MKKLQIALLIVLSSAFVTNGAIAQNKPLACQNDEVAGLDWESGRWVVKRFFLKKFILVQAGQTLTTASVATALVPKPENQFPDQITCNTAPHGRHISCTDSVGRSLYFDLKTLKGGIAKVFGATQTDAERDSVSVEVFSCTPF